MPLTFANVTTANSTTSNAALTTSSVSVSKGDWIIVAVAAKNAGTSGAVSLTGVTDSAGNTYEELTRITRTSGSANDGVTLGIYLAEVTTALSSGTISANFSPNTAAKAMSVKRITPGAKEKVSVETVGAGVTGNGTAFNAGAISVPNGYTIYGATAVEQTSAATADSDTTSGNWSTAHTAAGSTGTNSSSASISTQQKTVTAAGNQTYNTSTASSRDFAVNAVVLWAEPVVTEGSWAINGVVQ